MAPARFLQRFSATAVDACLGFGLGLGLLVTPFTRRTISGVIGEDMYTSVGPKQPFTYGSLNGDHVAVVSLARVIVDGRPELVRPAPSACLPAPSTSCACEDSEAPSQ